MDDVDSDSSAELSDSSQELSNDLVDNDAEGYAIEGETIEDDVEGSVSDVVTGCSFEEAFAVNCLEDISCINFKEVTEQDFLRYHFVDVGVAYTFYNWYASYNGFAARRSKVLRNKRTGDLTQQTFVCYRQGIVKEKSGPSTSRKRVPRPRVRCGCQAKCRVHIEGNNGRWYMKFLDNTHNHKLLDDEFTRMLPAHRKMTDHEIWRMSNMRQAGIKTSHIFGLFATEAGGFEKIGFRKRDMYNEQEKRRLTSSVDAKAACEYLESLRSRDETMFWRHKVDGNGRLSHLFWCDGAAQRDYSIFGDVVAFDATYKRNKYMCPLVVFSGVNHHNQTIVFCGAIVCDETEETYVWLLEQFLTAMGGKSPTSVITDGDVSMKKAIGRVFPKCHHRLCAWHLIRNACSNVGNTQFVTKFRQCMLGDYDVGEFQRRWEKMVNEFGLEGHKWVRDIYGKRHMWATAHIRGNFFAGFRTTSRCEGLHAQFGRYVNYQNNLVEFLHQFFRCLNYMRYTELEANFGSVHGNPAIETPLHFIERAAGELYTREVFLLVQPVIRRACAYTVVNPRQTTSYYFYTVKKYPKGHLEWQVSFSPTSLKFKCSCERLESLGIVCEHLVAVLVYLDIVTLPECLVLKRWTKNAKDSITLSIPKKDLSREPTMVSQFTNLVERCKRMAVAAVKCGKPQLMRNTVDLVDTHTKLLEEACASDGTGYVYNRTFFEDTILNPNRVRTKGCGATTSTRQTSTRIQNKVRKTQTCGVCKMEGHNRKSCPILTQTTYGNGTQVDSDGDDDEYEEFGDVGIIDMNVQ